MVEIVFSVLCNDAMKKCQFIICCFVSNVRVADEKNVYLFCLSLMMVYEWCVTGIFSYF